MESYYAQFEKYTNLQAQKLGAHGSLELVGKEGYRSW